MTSPGADPRSDEGSPRSWTGGTRTNEAPGRSWSERPAGRVVSNAHHPPSAPQGQQLDWKDCAMNAGPSVRRRAVTVAVFRLLAVSAAAVSAAAVSAVCPSVVVAAAAMSVNKKILVTGGNKVSCVLLSFGCCCCCCLLLVFPTNEWRPVVPFVRSFVSLVPCC
jgi:hypothetical protein